MHLKQNVFLIFFSPKIKMSRNLKKIAVSLEDATVGWDVFLMVLLLQYITVLSAKIGLELEPELWTKVESERLRNTEKNFTFLTSIFFSLLFSIFFHFYGPCDFLKMKIADFLDLGSRDSNSPGVYHFCVRQFKSFLLFLPHSS